jgi:hypothetical protein
MPTIAPAFVIVTGACSLGFPSWTITNLGGQGSAAYIVFFEGVEIGTGELNSQIVPASSFYELSVPLIGSGVYVLQIAQPYSAQYPVATYPLQCVEATP